MKKKEFIYRLKKEIKNLRPKEQQDIINYYSELIDDRIESGEYEEDIIASLGSIDLIVDEIMGERTFHYSESEEVRKTNRSHKEKSRNSSLLKIILLIVLAPFWFAGLMIFISVIFGIAVGSFSITISGIYYFIGSIIHISKDLYVGIIQCGISLILLAIGLLLMKYGIKLVTFIFKKVNELFKQIVNAGGNLNYE